MKNDFRFEKKWVFTKLDKVTLFSNLINSKLFFREQYSERTVNSVYFDNLDLKSAFDNLDGVSNREKFRVRWYGNNTKIFNNPILENKIKKNFQGYKIFFKLNDFDKKKLDNENLFQLTKSVNKLILNKNLYPISMTNYKRIYLISANNEIRATLDFDLQYKKLNNYIENFFTKVEDIVLEFKYPASMDTYLRKQISGITRISKNSKYINSLMSNIYQ
jgi:SPX domain protein involved in polyphosphate accumulation